MPTSSREDQDGAEDEEDDDDDDEWNPVCQGGAVEHDGNGHAKDVADAEEDDEEVRTQTHVGYTIFFPLGLVFVWIDSLFLVHLWIKLKHQSLEKYSHVFFFPPAVTHPIGFLLSTGFRQ